MKLPTATTLFFTAIVNLASPGLCQEAGEPTTITTLGGDRYDAVTLRETTPTGIKLFHSSGAATIDFNQLSDETLTAFRIERPPALPAAEIAAPTPEQPKTGISALNVAPSFRGIFPGITFQQIVAQMQREPLKFEYPPSENDKTNGIIFLAWDYDRIKDNPKLQNFWYVAIGDDGTKYEWSSFSVEMYEGKAMEVSFGITARDASFLSDRTLPWATMLLKLLTQKYGPPTVIYSEPENFKVTDISSGFEFVFARWKYTDYEIKVGVSEHQSTFSANVTYTLVKLKEANKKDSENIKSNF